MQVIYDTWARDNGYDPDMLLDARSWFFKQMLYGTLEGMLTMGLLMLMMTWCMVGVFYWHNSRRSPC